MLYSHAPVRRSRSCSFAELYLRLKSLQKYQLPAEAPPGSICIGLEDPPGAIAHVVRTSRLVEALKVLELVVDAGWVPVHDAKPAGDEDAVMRVYRRPA